MLKYDVFSMMVRPCSLLCCGKSLTEWFLGCSDHVKGTTHVNRQGSANAGVSLFAGGVEGDISLANGGCIGSGLSGLS